MCGLGITLGVILYNDESCNGDFNSNMKILVKRVLENVTVMQISFLLHKYLLKYGLIRYLLNQLAWVDLSYCDLYQLELSGNQFDSNIESCQCDSNLQIVFAHFFQLHN